MRLKRNKFNLSHTNLLTCNMGQLVPVMCELALPGDKWRIKPSCVMRVAPLLAPMMHNVKLYFHTFSVPLRLLMNEAEWESFITGGVDGTDSSILPTITFPEGISVGSLGDYIGYPTNTPAFGSEPAKDVNGITVSALPFRAYALIWNEWYRNQTIQDPLPVSTAMGNDVTTNTTLMYRNWRKDYFTSALPSQQRGGAVYLPMGANIPVFQKAMVANNSTISTGLLWTRTDNGGIFSPNSNVHGNSVSVRSDGNTTSAETTNSNNQLSTTFNLAPRNLFADGTNAQGTSLSDFRWANAVQTFMERQMRGGARYVETLMSQFGVRSSDARLQRPEYIGGGVSQLVVMPVLQTSSTDTVSPQGNMSGQAFSMQSNRPFKHFFEEHCIVMTLMSIMPDTMYQQGMRRWTMYRTRYDFPWPVFSHTSEQELFKGELYATGNNDMNYEPFGFVPRYEECRRIPSSVHGEFKTSLNYWHMARIFNNQPQLNSAFITSDPTKRINAVTDEHNCWCDVAMEISALRALPKQGTPSLRTSV